MPSEDTVVRRDRRSRLLGSSRRSRKAPAPTEDKEVAAEEEDDIENISDAVASPPPSLPSPILQSPPRGPDRLLEYLISLRLLGSPDHQAERLQAIVDEAIRSRDEEGTFQSISAHLREFCRPPQECTTTKDAGPPGSESIRSNPTLPEGKQDPEHQHHSRQH